jgi:hypothetical protein
MDLVRGVGINLFLVPNEGRAGDGGMMPNRINEFPYGGRKFLRRNHGEQRITIIAATFAASSQIATIVAIRHPLRGDLSTSLFTCS